MKTSELIKLVKDTFLSEPGSSLLQALKQEVSGPMYDENTNKMYHRVGQYDLVSRLEMLANADSEFLDAVYKQEAELNNSDEEYDV